MGPKGDQREPKQKEALKVETFVKKGAQGSSKGAKGSLRELKKAQLDQWNSRNPKIAARNPTKIIKTLKVVVLGTFKSQATL